MLILTSDSATLSTIQRRVGIGQPAPVALRNWVETHGRRSLRRGPRRPGKWLLGVCFLLLELWLGACSTCGPNTTEQLKVVGKINIMPPTHSPF